MRARSLVFAIVCVLASLPIAGNGGVPADALPKHSATAATSSAAPPSASPCPSAAPKPSPCPSAALKVIGTVKAVGRQVNLVGQALSASTGTIGQEQIATRPLLRPGEVLEDIPGLVISQHSGGGKANQYYLRGFQLDHGTDLDADINDIPVNLGTHAHGQGYSDINYLIPELVGSVEFKKGPYFADQGDFSTAGGYDLSYRDTIPATASFTAGDFGYDRLLSANSFATGPGNLLYALEIAHDNGSYEKPDEYHRVNGVVRYSISKGANDFNVTGIAYDGAFASTDQIPQRLVNAGILGRFGYVDPTDGGNTYRYALSSEFNHLDPNGSTKFDAFGVSSLLDLFSNFTYDFFDANDYYNVTRNPVTCNAAYASCTPNSGAAGSPRTNKYQSYCPANNTAAPAAAPHSVLAAPYSFSCGDQREQLDRRVYGGFQASRTFVSPGTESVIAAGLRNDNVPTVGLYLTKDMIRYPNGTLSNDHVTITEEYAYLQSRLRFGQKLRVTTGLRFDHYDDTVAAYDPENSGAANASVLDPKFALAYAMSPHQELYADFGESFHSNDARGAIGVNDPQTHAPFDPSGDPVYRNAPLTRASGYELGYRFSSPKLTTTFSAFRLLLDNELVFDGDHGDTSVGNPTVRQGVELANFYTPAKFLTVDADLATTTARATDDPLNVGTGVPESLAAVISAGATVDEPHYAASLRMRYFGPRQLDSQGLAASPPSMLFNTQFSAKLSKRNSITVDVFNILNARVADVTYYYGSWLPYDAANPKLENDPAINPALGGQGVNDYHFHPSQARTARLTFTSGI